MSDPLAGSRIGLGVTGSIAAYKALAIASRLTQAGAMVDVILTRSAQEFVRTLAFQALTHRSVVADLWAPVGPLGLDHVSIGRAVDALVVAPATADVLARLALGRADDALTATALVARAPLLLAPAMEPRMWSHPATQAHVATLVVRGATLCGPSPGRMASGEEGVGRLAEVEAIVDHVRIVLAQARGGALAGRRVVVTAGPTREPLDPVRYLSNHSSGSMGWAVAVAARDRAAAVVLIAGTTIREAPPGVQVIGVETALEMHDAVLTHAPDADVLVMTAAVADYRPAVRHAAKVKKGPGEEVLALVRNPDILVDLDRALGPDARRPVRVGFAAETEDLVANAERKLVAKGLDLVVANPVPATFGGGVVTAILVDARGATPLPELSKRSLADVILDRAVELLTPGTDRRSDRPGEAEPS